MENINSLVNVSVFGNPENQKKSRIKIRELAARAGIYPASIHTLYLGFGKGELGGFSVPAINIRNMTYDFARLVFRLAKELHIGPFIFEIARGEVGYTDQTHDEYATSVLAAAVSEQWKGPVFIQADHTQFSAPKFQEDPQGQLETLKSFIKSAIDAGFYNIDIDASTLVDLGKTSLNEQQKNNAEMTAALTAYVRSIEPSDVTVSVGAEIGHIGGKNSTVEEFEAFMQLFISDLTSQFALFPLIKEKYYKGTIPHLSKISVQTGTSHGGIMLKDGSMQAVAIDFDVHTGIGKSAREKYGMGGPVQHGASTVPVEFFHKFVESKAIEVHLATGFQNIMYSAMPEQLKREMGTWLDANCASEKKEGQTHEQFLYVTRKKANKPFKKVLWQLSDEEKKPILQGLEKELRELFSQLHLENTDKMIKKYV